MQNGLVIHLEVVSARLVASLLMSTLLLSACSRISSDLPLMLYMAMVIDQDSTLETAIQADFRRRIQLTFSDFRKIQPNVEVQVALYKRADLIRELQRRNGSDLGPDLVITDALQAKELLASKLTEALPSKTLKRQQTSVSKLKIKKCQLSTQTRAESQRKAGACHRSPTQPFEDEQNCRRRHIAVILENDSRVVQNFGIQSQRLSAGRENLRTAWVYSPAADLREIDGPSLQPILQPGQQCCPHRCRHQRRQSHRKTMITYLPVHQISTVGDHHRTAALQYQVPTRRWRPS